MDPVDELTPDECWRLLGLVSIGRLALSIRALPTILPVRYAVEGESVVIGLGRNDLPFASLDDAVVAFAVDQIEDTGGRDSGGWIVQMQGRTRLSVRDLTPPSPGAPSERSEVLMLSPGTMSGQRFALLPLAPGP
jgi:uncharacterized protein